MKWHLKETSKQSAESSGDLEQKEKEINIIDKQQKDNLITIKEEIQSEDENNPIKTDEKILRYRKNPINESINTIVNDTWYTCVSHIDSSRDLSNNTIKNEIKEENTLITPDEPDEWFDESEYERIIRSNLSEE